jgi:hypothetical protein
MSDHRLDDDYSAPSDRERSTPNTDVTEQITVPDRDLGPFEMAHIMRQIARCANFLASRILREAGVNDNAGAENQVVQAIIGCAAQASVAYMALEGPRRVAPGVPPPMPKGWGGGGGRA